MKLRRPKEKQRKVYASQETVCIEVSSLYHPTWAAERKFEACNQHGQKCSTHKTWTGKKERKLRRQ
eukprot:1142196-Pelagomonas_calceolata.AAC.1